jgi:Zn-dependent protease with chaperone function
VNTPYPTPLTLAVEYFDGKSARAHQVRIFLQASMLHINGDALALHVPEQEVRWPERTRHGGRVAHLRGGGSLQAPHPAAWDDWAKASGIHESKVVKAQQSWRGAFIALGLMVALGVAGYQWGVPWVSRAALLVVPESIDQSLGETVLSSMNEVLLLPSSVPLERQKKIREAFAQVMAKSTRMGPMPKVDIRFHTSAKKSKSDTTLIGSNAFALPGGVVVITDEMLQLLEGRDDILMGVLAHELGHVRHRHGMRMLVQSTLIGAAASALWGDFSTLLATAPVVLGQSAYSRDFEREADEDAISMMKANQISPAVMAEFFERLESGQSKKSESKPGEHRPDKSTTKSKFDLGIALASHPSDEERINRFRVAVRGD